MSDPTSPSSEDPISRPEHEATPADAAAPPAPPAPPPAAEPVVEPAVDAESTPADAEAGGEATAPPADAPAAEGTAATDDAASADEAPSGEAPSDEAAAAPSGAKRRRKGTRERGERKRPLKTHRKALTPELKAEAEAAARDRICAHAKRDRAAVEAALDLLAQGRHLVFVARFRRRETLGMDERTLRHLREDFERAREEEERRVELRELLRDHGALDEKTAHRLQEARGVPAMEDLAAGHLPVVAGRATVARGLGLHPLADAIRDAQPGGPDLSELAQAFVKADEEPKSLDAALGGARDILAEEITLSPALRARLRKLFRREARITVALRAERKGDAGRHKSLVGFTAPAHDVPPLKLLAIRRAEKERVVSTTIEPPEEMALALVHETACADEHPHAGFLRAAAEDGYRRILKPLLAGEVRGELKDRADAHAMETFERNLRHRLLGPVGGPRRALGLRPDVTGGHRWVAVDAEGEIAGWGQLPHEGTVGREAAIQELREVLTTYEVEAVAIGSGGGRQEAGATVGEAVQGLPRRVDVSVVSDGGTHALESMGPISFPDRPDPMPAEMRGALSLARRFQDPLRELVRLDPKVLALGPHLHDVHQGRLRRLLDETVSSCVARVGVDASEADVDMIARLPGMDRTRARDFLAWRDAYGPLRTKAALAAVPGVGAEAAEQAVGFLRVPDAADPRDRTQLHPELYAIVDRMAEQVGADVETLFADASLRRQIRLDALATDEVPLPTLKYVLYELVAGAEDERPRFARPIEPPPGITLQTLQEGLLLEGRVVRVMPFGVFVDVGLGTDALIPNAHVGDHPGVDVATVAPLGAVIQARVLEVVPEKRRITLTMRSPRREPFRGRGGPRGGHGGRGPREGERGERPEGAGARGDRGREGGRGGRGRDAGGRGGRGGGPRKGGRFEGGGLGDLFAGRGRRDDDRRKPTRHVIGADEGHEAEDRAEEQGLTPEELLAKKLEQLQKKFGGGR